jgi:hypothetical protein
LRLKRNSSVFPSIPRLPAFASPNTATADAAVHPAADAAVITAAAAQTANSIRESLLFHSVSSLSYRFQDPYRLSFRRMITVFRAKIVQSPRQRLMRPVTFSIISNSRQSNSSLNPQANVCSVPAAVQVNRMQAAAAIAVATDNIKQSRTAYNCRAGLCFY